MRNKSLVMGKPARLTALLLCCFAVAAPVAVHAADDRKYPEKVYATEDETEFATSSTSGGRLKGAAAVGDFTLDAQAGFALSACDMIQAQFASETECGCSSSKLYAPKPVVNYGCQHSHKSCWRARQVCADLSYTGIVGESASAGDGVVVTMSGLSLKGLEVAGERFGDLTVSVERNQNDDMSLRKCMAVLSLGGTSTKCTCTVCDKQGIKLDCGHKKVKSGRCDEIGLISTISGGAAAAPIVDFLPSFHKSHED